jgi:hypothetical protein
LKDVFHHSLLIFFEIKPNRMSRMRVHKSARRFDFRNKTWRQAQPRRRRDKPRLFLQMVFDLISPLSREECARALRSKIDPAWGGTVVGSVNETSFRLRKRISYRNSFQASLFAGTGPPSFDSSNNSHGPS